MTTTSKKQNLGQYFTTHSELKEKVFEFILNAPDCILEPSIGQGDLVQYIAERMPGTTFDMYEIDSGIPLLPTIEKYKDQVVYGDFMLQPIAKKYQTILGNPPYIRTKKGNLYIDFVEKCYNLLDSDGGELIFIVPSDFLKLTSAAKLLNTMMTNGTFTHIFHPNNERMFKNASIDVIVFRYCKGSLSLNNRVLYNGQTRYITNSSGLITFAEDILGDYGTDALFQEYFDICVGLVSGKEEVYKNAELGNISVLNAEDKTDKYIYIEEYPCDNPRINEYLLLHKKSLIERKIRKFNEANWFEWGAPRNIGAMRENIGADCIYICNMTRKPDVAFLGKCGYFGGGLLMLLPKKTCDLEKIVAYINSNRFKGNFMFSGRFKMGHRQISNSYIPSEFL